MLVNNLALSIFLWCLIVAGSLIVCYLLFYLVSWIFVFSCCLCVNKKQSYEKSNVFWRGVLNYGYFLLISFARIKVVSKGLEKLPKDKNFVIISNHRSKFDNMIIAYKIRPQKLAFISKKENFKIPFVNRLILRNCYQSLDRGNIRSAIQVINTSAKLIMEGECSIGVFPEGTRSKDNQLLEFMPGCLKVASIAKCPIVVCSLQGTENIHKNFPLRRTKVEFEILDVISENEVAAIKTVELSEKSYTIISNKIKQSV